MIQKNQAWLTLWYHCFEHNCVDEFYPFPLSEHNVWQQIAFCGNNASTLARTLFSAANKGDGETFKPEDKWPCEETQSTCERVWGLPSQPVPLHSKLHLFQKAKDKGPKRWEKVSGIKLCDNEKKLSCTWIPGGQHEIILCNRSAQRGIWRSTEWLSVTCWEGQPVALLRRNAGSQSHTESPWWWKNNSWP